MVAEVRPTAMSWRGVGAGADGTRRVYHSGVAALRRAFLAAALAWAVLLPLAAFAATHARRDSAGMAFAFLLYSAGAIVCHQKPERSFLVWGAQMPVCARCAGIYLGAAAAAGAAAIGLGTRASLAAARSVGASRLVLALASLPTTATLAYEWTTGIMPSNPVRAAAGLPLGVAIVVLVLGGLGDRGRRLAGPESRHVNPERGIG